MPILVLIVHHIAVDLYSLAILAEDMVSLCSQISTGLLPTLPPKSTSFRKWAALLSDRSETTASRKTVPYWQRIICGGPPLSPPCRPNASNTEREAAVVTEYIRSDTVLLLDARLQAIGATTLDALVAALGAGLAAWSSDGSVLFDLERHGREPLFEDIDLSRTVGWFTTLEPVRITAPRDASADNLLDAARAALGAGPSHAVDWGLARYGPDAGLLANAPPRAVSLNFLGVIGQPEGGTPAREAVSPGFARDPDAPRPYLVEIIARREPSGLRIDWIYSATALAASEIQARASATSAALHDFATGAAPERIDVELADIDEETLHELVTELTGDEMYQNE